MLIAGPFIGYSAWERVSGFPSAELPVSLAACHEEVNCYYTATQHAVFKDSRGVWRLLFSLPDLSETIMRIDTFPSIPGLWIRTENSIFLYQPETALLTSIYATHDETKSPLAFFADEKILWLGTPSGLWSSQDTGRSWQKNSELADSLPVALAVKTSIGLFFSAANELRIKENDSPQTVLKLFDFRNVEIDESSPISEEASLSGSLTPQVFFDLVETDEMFYVATSKGVFQSRNGWDWIALSNSGLSETAFYRVFWNKNSKQLCGFTNAGFFIWDPKANQWHSENFGLAKRGISALLLSPEFEMAATAEGLWQWVSALPSAPVCEKRAAVFNRLIQLEPSMREIHQRVIRYSGTSNAKIKRWHTESRLAALAPSLSIGRDWGTSNNVDLDRGGTNDPDRFIDGPWDRNRGADVDVSWDLGDFFFSSSQTSIDSRAKLMVDQRNDLLAETTRLFYERRRLQAEMIYAPAPDEKIHFERLLRIEEVTALIDALTDGYLSSRVERIYRNNPELETLWTFTSESALRKI